MSDKTAEVETETTTGVTGEQQPDEDSKVVETEEQPSEETDETGVPVKNRLAEANRKLRKAQEKEQELEKAQETLTQQPDIPEDEAIRLVESIAERQTKKVVEPLIVEQFLNRNPDAANMVDDINRVRVEHPELSSVDQLELAYKVAKAEKQDEIIRKKVELQRQEAVEREEKSNQSSIEGTGKKAPAMSLDDKIKGAKTLDELQEIEKLIQR
jgi:hypothetical protein